MVHNMTTLVNLTFHLLTVPVPLYCTQRILKFWKERGILLFFSLFSPCEVLVSVGGVGSV
jgi:hypothetical protein